MNLIEKKGFNLVGYATSPMGLGEDLRSFADVLDYLEIPFSVTDLITDVQNQVQIYWKNLTKTRYDITIFFMSPIECEKLYSNNPKIFESSKIRIGYFLWELPHFPMNKCQIFRHIDQIWCPTKFVQNTLYSASKKLTLKISLPVSLEEPSKKDFRNLFNIPKNDFVVLYMFDVHSTISRKNPDAVLRVFSRFNQIYPNSWLILKINRHEGLFSINSIKNLSNIKVIKETLTKREIVSLYKISDCYLSLHRSEGFGRTLVEAMKSSLPVIATNFSGPSDFLSRNNSYIVDYKITDVYPGDYPHATKSFWCNPNEDIALEQLKIVYKNINKKIISEAIKTSNRYSIKNIANQYEKFLQNLINHSDRIK